MASIIDAITTQWTIYPDGQGHFALGSPDGRTLQQDETVAITLGGFWIPGVIRWNHGSDYFITLVDHTVCGLCAGMQVRPLQDEDLPADRGVQLREWRDRYQLRGKEALA